MQTVSLFTSDGINLGDVTFTALGNEGLLDLDDEDLFWRAYEKQEYFFIRTKDGSWYTFQLPHGDGRMTDIRKCQSPPQIEPGA